MSQEGTEAVMALPGDPGSVSVRSEHSPPDAAQPTHSRYRYVVVAILVLVYTVNFLDRQIMALLVQPIGKDLALTDTQLGLLSGLAFAIFYATLGVPVARLADRFSRVHVIAIACTLWSGFTMACGLANNFIQLALSRMGVGVGEAGGAPPSYSLISDYFPPAERGLAMSLFSLGIPLGATLGTAFGALIADAYGWRTAFFVAGAPGLVLTLLLLLVVKEPVRGRLDASVSPHENVSLPRALAKFFANPILRCTATSSALSAVVAYGSSAWVPTYLIRVRGMSMGEIALWYSVVNGVTLAAGIFLSGWLADRLAHRHAGSYALVPALLVLLSLPFYAGFLLAPSWPLALILFALPGLTFNMYLPPALSVIQNAVHPNERSTAGAIHLLALNLVGLGVGPLLVGFISDHLAARQGETSLAWGLAALIPVSLAAIFFLFRGARLLSRRAPS